MSHSWQGDWHARIRKKVESLGFANVTAFARIHPHKTFEELAKELGRPDPDIAPIEAMFRETGFPGACEPGKEADGVQQA